MSSFDPLEHPRWPRDTPDGRGGEFRSTNPGGGWLSAVAGGWMRPEELLELAQRDDHEASRLAGGNSALTELRRYPDGRLAVYKSSGDEPAAAEVKAYLVARAIGAPVPTVVAVPDEPYAVLMEYVHGKTPNEVAIARALDPQSGMMESAFLISSIDETKRSVRDSDDAIRIGLLDLLIANPDRNSGNWIVRSDGSIVAIDHGSTFDRVDWKFDQRGASYGSWFSQRHFLTSQDRWKGNPLHPDDVSLAMDRIDDLHQVGALTGNEHRNMMDLLAILRSKATGTRRLIT